MTRTQFLRYPMWSVLLTLALARSAARADITTPADFTLSVGYANISIGNSDSELDCEGALKWEPAFTIAPIAQLPQLRLGAAFGVSLVLDNSSHAIISNNGQLIIAGTSDVPLWLLEPQARISWRQSFGNFFVEPGFGIGGAIGYLSVDGSGSFEGQSYEKWSSAWAGTAYIYAGLQVTGGLAGLEFSYTRGGKLDFGDNARGNLDEYYIGIFGTLQF
jgi:hypothetical protein